MYDRSEYFDMHDNPMHVKRVIEFNECVVVVVQHTHTSNILEIDQYVVEKKIDRSLCVPHPQRMNIINHVWSSRSMSR